VVALIIVAGLAVGAYWIFPRNGGTDTLQAGILINRTSGPHPLSLSVTASVSGGSPPYQFQWSFGDGGAASGPGASHVYLQRGIYQVQLTVTDRTGQTAAAGKVVHVAPVLRQTTLLNTSSQTLGAGPSSAWVVPIVIPGSAVSTWMNGTVHVTVCSLGGNCLAYVEVLDVQDETNLTQGKAVSNPIWCSSVNGTCQAAQSVGFNVDLSGIQGQTVYLVVYNSDLVWSQQVTAHVSAACWY
jgi:hypothetical protein